MAKNPVKMSQTALAKIITGRKILSAEYDSKSRRLKLVLDPGLNVDLFADMTDFGITGEVVK